MTPEEKKEIEDTITTSITDALGPYQVSKEQHLLDHNWIKEFREWSDGIKSTAWKTIVKLIIRGIAILLIVGFIMSINKTH